MIFRRFRHISKFTIRILTILIIFLGTNPTSTDCPGDPTPITRRTEDSHLRFGEETRRATRNYDTDTATDATEQTRGLFHPIQDTGNEKIIKTLLFMTILRLKPHICI